MQRLHLVLHLAEGRPGRPLERGIDLRHDVRQLLHAIGDQRRHAGERVLDARRQLALEQVVQGPLVLRLQRRQGQFVPRQEAHGRGVGEGRGRALVHQRHGDAEVRVDLAQLAQVGQLVRPRDVADGREDRILHQRPQQHVGAEVSRLAGGFLGECLQGRRLVANRHPVAGGPMASRAAGQVKERDSAFVRRDLSVVAGRDERLPGTARQSGRVAGLGDLGREDAGRQRLGRRIGRVVDHQAVRPEHGLDPAPEGLGHAAAGLVGGAQPVEHVGAELGLGQQGGQRVERGRDVRGEGEAGDGTLAGAGQVGQTDGLGLERRVQDRTAGDLRPVVILGVDPEDGHHCDAVIAFDGRGQFHRRQRLQQREERAAEQPGLLSRDDDAGRRVGEPRRVVARRGRRLARRLLSGDQAGQCLRLATRGLRSANRVGPCRGVGGVAGEEGRDLLVRERVVGRQAPDPRELADVDGERAGGGRCGQVGRHRRVLSQSAAERVNCA